VIGLLSAVLLVLTAPSSWAANLRVLPNGQVVVAQIVPSD
jgi:hypothetical protein